MKNPLYILALLFGFSMLGTAEIVKLGTDIKTTEAAMKEAGFRVTGLDLVHRSNIAGLLGEPKVLDEEVGDLKFWQVGEGILIASYTVSTGKITDLTYYFCDERAKAERKDFSLVVSSFDTNSGAMLVQIGQPE